MVDIEAMFTESARLIAITAAHPQPVATGLTTWFDYCERVAPAQQPLWQQLRQLDFDADERRLTDWLSQLLSAEPPPELSDVLQDASALLYMMPWKRRSHLIAKDLSKKKR